MRDFGCWLLAALLVQGYTRWVSAFDNTPQKAHVRASTADTGRYDTESATAILSRPDQVPANSAKAQQTHTVVETNSTDGGEPSFRNLTDGSAKEILMEEKMHMIKRDGSREVLDENEVRA